MEYPVINIINGCMLFPHAADSRMPPAHKRVWETNIAETIKGAESRAAMRAVPRRQITYLVTCDLQERERLEARMDAAASMGFGCCPLHGRYSQLMNAAPAGSKANILLNTNGGWDWQPGDYAILIQDDETYDVAAVINTELTADGTWTADSGLPVDQPALSLATPLNFGWAAGALVWPLIFGKFTPAKEDALTAEHGAVRITVAELTSGRSEQIGQTPANEIGVGQQVVGATNVVG